MDTTNIDPMTLLGLAADRLEALAARSTPGPWIFRRRPDSDYDELKILAGEAAANGGASGPSEEFIVDGRDIGDLWESDAVPGEQAERLAGAHEWMATMHPGMAGPLAGWLRFERGRLEQVSTLHLVLTQMAAHQSPSREALEFARLVLASAPVPQGQPQ